MKKTIEIECPHSYKPIYNAETDNVKIVPEDIIDQIKTYEDAKNYLEYVSKDTVHYGESIIALAKLQTILKALNENHRFDLLTGAIWYPYVRFYRINRVPIDAITIGHFRYRGEKFTLVGGLADNGSDTGLGYFDSDFGVGYAVFDVGLLTCKSKKIAKYVSTQFGKLIFDACFAGHFNSKEFEWLD